MLLAISSQISILLAGLQRLEGQQRHPQPPPPPPVPDGQPPPPPPPSVHAGNFSSAGLLDSTRHSCGHLGQPDGAHCSCPHGESQYFLDGGEGPDTGNLIGVGLAAAVTTGDLLAALTTQFPRPTAAPPLRSTRRQSSPCRRVDHRVSHITVDGTPAAKGPQ